MKNIKNRRKIVQFSPIRSGSTLVTNILRELFPERTVRKSHDIKSLSRKAHLHLIKFPVVSTCRYPLDIVASELKVNNVKPTAMEIERACQTLDHNGLIELKKILNMKNVLLLKYEDFYGNLNFLFDSFENFFDIVIDKQIRVKLEKDYSIDSIKKLTDNLPADQFIDTSRSASTGGAGVFHGKHISESKGRPGSYKSFFNEEQIEWLRYRFSDFIKDFDYHKNEL